MTDYDADPGNEPDAPAAGSQGAPPAPEAAQEAVGDGESVTLATVNPYSTFDPGIEGVPVVTNAGTQVPAASVPDIFEAAASADVQLKEI